MRAYAALLLLLSPLPALAADNKAEIDACLADRTWPDRSETFLYSQHGVTRLDWPLLSPQRQEKICGDWARQRLSAVQSQRMVRLQGSPATEDQARHLRLLADSGLLNTAEVAQLGGLRSRSGAALLDASAIRPIGIPEAQRALAGTAFRENESAGGDRSATQSKAPAKRLAIPLEAEEAYRAARQMALDPEGFAKARPELLGAPPPAEQQERARLRQRLGRLFEEADRQRARRKFEIRFASDAALEGRFSDRSVEQGRTVIRINAALRDADPVLLAPTVVHELQQAFGAGSADAFRAEQALGAGYATILEAAFRQRMNRASVLLYGSHQKLMEVLTEPEPALRQSRFKALVNTEDQR